MGWTFYNSSGQRLQTFGFVAATQAEMEAASSTTAYVTPGRTQYHPGVAKAWVQIEANGASVLASHNIASVVDSGTGDRDINYTTAFSGNNYAVAGFDTGIGVARYFANDQVTTADIRVLIETEGTTRTDSQHSVVMFGDQS